MAMWCRVLWSVVYVCLLGAAVGRRRDDKTKCPEVRATPHFDLTQMLGSWYVVEYYASAEEEPSYSCMRAVFRQEDHITAADGSVEWAPAVTMNFTYEYANDPSKEALFGNITWKVDLSEPAHWMHAEKTYIGVYNTYVLDTEYKTWALLLHCAEQKEETRYFSAFVLSRNSTLPVNVLAYLRDKLPRYEVDVRYVFAIPHTSCAPRAPLPDDSSPLLVDVDHAVRRSGAHTDSGQYNVDDK